MVVIDLGEFAEDGFDPKRWINAALETRHPQDPLERYISDLEESLRSSSENIADTLEKESADALRRVPLAVRDVLRLRDEAMALRSVVSSILLKLKKVHPPAFWIPTARSNLADPCRLPGALVC